MTRSMYVCMYVMIMLTPMNDTLADLIICDSAQNAYQYIEKDGH